MDKAIEKAAVLIEALPYIQRFRDKIVVVKFGGSAMEDPELTQSALRDIVFMECVGMRPVVVHGGGKAITKRLKEMNIPTKFINGLRYTCEQTIKVVDEVLHDEVNIGLVEGIRAQGGAARSLSGKNVLKAKRIFSADKATGERLDLGFVGDIYDIESAPILQAFEQGVIPVITPLAKDDSGAVLNVNADLAASRVAEILKARKLVFLSDVPGLLRDPSDESTVISTVNMDEVESLVASGVISGGMAPKIHSAVRALKAGTNKVHLIDGRIKHSLLLEIFTNSGIGTEIVKSKV